MLKLKSYSDGHNNENEPTARTSPLPYPSRSPSILQTDWPFLNLDTIAERSHSRSLHSAASAPKLRHSVHSSSGITRAKGAIAADSTLFVPPVGNYKSLSAPEIDLMKPLVRYHCSAGSSSSFQALQNIPINPAGPALPVAEPIQRRPTPDGLPSFGSKEAQELRLHPENSLFRRARMLGQWLRGDRDASDDAVSERSPALPAAERPSVGSVESSDGRDRSVPMDMLQRLFGAPRIVDTSEHSVSPVPRIGLPRGVSVADSPGALAIAPDGTLVRGKFGARMSAHGVSSRPLTSHPLACERSEHKSVPNEHLPELRSMENTGVAGTTLPRQPIEPGISFHRATSLDHTARQSSHISPRSSAPVRQSAQSPSSLGSPVMSEPPPYPPSLNDRNEGGFSQWPARIVRIGGGPFYGSARLVLGEHRQQDVQEKERQSGCCHKCHSGCHNLWASVLGFCRICYHKRCDGCHEYCSDHHHGCYGCCHECGHDCCHPPSTGSGASSARGGASSSRGAAASGAMFAPVTVHYNAGLHGGCDAGGGANTGGVCHSGGRDAGCACIGGGAGGF